MHLTLHVSPGKKKAWRKALCRFFEETLKSQLECQRQLRRGEYLVRVDALVTDRADDSEDILVVMHSPPTEQRQVDAVTATIRLAHEDLYKEFTFSLTPPGGGRFTLEAQR